MFAKGFVFEGSGVKGLGVRQGLAASVLMAW